MMFSYIYWMTTDWWQTLSDYTPKLIEAIQETSIMMLFSTAAAILLGLPLGILVFLTSNQQILSDRPWAKGVHALCNVIINIVRSFPFLLLVVAMQPIIRQVYGRATGDPVAASFPMMVIAIALYARFVEQSLMDVPKGVTDLAQALGATPWQFVRHFLLVEARSSLIIGFTTAFVSFISYSTIMGVVGGGGIGDFAIRYGYQRYEEEVMYLAIILMIVLVQVIQWLGLRLGKHLDRR